MKINEVLERAGKKPGRKRRGRGTGSGLGKTCGRGHKGAKCRSGWKQRYGYEGGQMPLVRRLPKRGFSNFRFQTRYDVVNLSTLQERFESGDRVDLDALAKAGVVKPRHGRLKVLASGDLTKNLVIVADKISAAARQKVEAAGGKVEAAPAVPGPRARQDPSTGET
jgi:large subunit ribosomal protein L15